MLEYRKPLGQAVCFLAQCDICASTGGPVALLQPGKLFRSTCPKRNDIQLGTRCGSKAGGCHRRRALLNPEGCDCLNWPGVRAKGSQARVSEEFCKCKW